MNNEEGSRTCCKPPTPNVENKKAHNYPPPPPPWHQLPDDVLSNILHRIGVKDILWTAQKVCSKWRRVCKDPSMWRHIDMRLDNDDRLHLPFDYDPEKMCRVAVDLSQGQLVDITIENGTDELLRYIGQRCIHLKCLTLEHCCKISGEGLARAVERFPELEKLCLDYCCYNIHITDKHIEIIGTSCPKLKSFSYRGRRKSRRNADADRNVRALAIAKNMPNLHHLGVSGDRLNNVGLEAILNGCPQLESLDISFCSGINLREDLGKRCSEQIRILICYNTYIGELELVSSDDEDDEDV